MVKLPEAPKPGDSANLNAETAPAIQKPIRPADAQDTIGENQDFEDVEALLAAGAPKGTPPAAKSVAPAKATVPAKSAAGHVKSPARDKPSRFAEGESAVGAGPAGANGSGTIGINGKAAPASTGAAKDSSQLDAAPPVPGSEALPLPCGDWSSERPWKSWLFLAVSILLGMGLAFGVVAFSLSFFRDDTPVAVNPDPNPAETKPAETIPSSETPSTETDKAKPSGPEKNPVEKATPPVENEGPAKPKTEKSKTEGVKSTLPAVEEEDPLGIKNKPAEESKPTTTPGAKDQFSKFEKLLGNPRDPTAPAPAPAATVPNPARPEVPPAEVPTKPSLPRPAPRVISIPTRMNDPLPGLKIAADEVSLADFLQAMQDFSTIPITLEPDNLAVFKLSADSPVKSFEGENLKFGSALASVLAPMGLEMAVEEEQIIVRKPELIRDPKSREFKLMTVNYAVGDLTHDEEKQATELAEQAMALIEPGSWGDDEEKEEPKAEGSKGDDPKTEEPKAEESKESCTLVPGKDQFSVRHRLSAQVQFLTLIQKLRIARGLPLQGKGADAETFLLATRTEKAATRLAAPVSLTFNRPTPLVKICQNLAKLGKVRILIDWRSIAPTGWNPDAEVTLVVDKKPLSETLTALLEPMDLAYRVVDGRTIQIVSPQYLQEHLELELHPAKELVASQEQIEPLLARVRASLTEGAADPPSQLWLDPESKCLVAMLPQPKQQLLTRLLAEWKTKETN